MKEIIKEILGKHSSDFNRKILTAIEKYWDGFNEIYTLLQDYSKSYKAINTLSISLDYPPIDYINPILLSEFIPKNLNEDNVKKNWDDSMVSYFDKYHLKDIEQNIKSYNIPQKDVDILIEIVDGYKNGFYFLVITTLLTRIEGLFFNFFNYKGSAQGKLLKLVEETLDKSGNNNTSINNDDHRLVKDYYKKKLNAKFEYGEPNIMKDLKRHPIIHGYSNEYGTKENSIKLILFYEYFYHSLCNLSKKDIIDIKREL